eukprot:TRINITY_DN3214_c0_g1_i2.p1 TRINITY_DN3214_c0_g1~~TRINITY_DN3214_c0_g1_i2.p1  ORF type:complete len:355 (+),score=48.35 TRINITY_DN3214_c0_g1_i2:199-1263(+)
MATITSTRPRSYSQRRYQLHDCSPGTSSVVLGSQHTAEVDATGGQPWFEQQRQWTNMVQGKLRSLVQKIEDGTGSDGPQSKTSPSCQKPLPSIIEFSKPVVGPFAAVPSRHSAPISVGSSALRRSRSQSSIRSSSPTNMTIDVIPSSVTPPTTATNTKPSRPNASISPPTSRGFTLPSINTMPTKAPSTPASPRHMEDMVPGNNSRSWFGVMPSGGPCTMDVSSIPSILQNSHSYASTSTSSLTSSTSPMSLSEEREAASIAFAAAASSLSGSSPFATPLPTPSSATLFAKRKTMMSQPKGPQPDTSRYGSTNNVSKRMRTSTHTGELTASTSPSPSPSAVMSINALLNPMEVV